MQTIQLKTPEILEKIKWNENSQLENFRKFKYTSRAFLEILKNAVPFATGISRHSSRKFWPNGKRRETTRTLVSLGTSEQSSRKSGTVQKVNR